MEKIGLGTSFIWILVILGYLVLAGCRKEEVFISDTGAQVSFSLDTLRFDTVFTELGSATKFLKIYNPHRQWIRISKISISNKAGAFFRMNVDGVPGNVLEDVEIPPRDSVYLFAEVTINPNAPLSESPFVIEDEITLETNGNIQKIHLEAWGQNANYFPNRFGGGGIWSPCTSPQITWDDPKPYVIFGILAIDACVLNMAAGTRVYVHGGITRNTQLGVYNDGIIIVLRNGQLRINGTKDQPVIIQGDRLEDAFAEVPGQWAGIIIDNESIGNQINFAEIKNSSIGIAVDSAAFLTINHSKIYNTSSVGIAGIHSYIHATNCLIHSNGGNAVQFVFGGNYQFDYCTLASYGVDAAALSMSNGVCYDPPFCERIAGFNLNARFRNSILFGSRPDEISLLDYTPTNARFDYFFEHCIVRVRDLLDPEKGGYPDFFQFCNPCINAGNNDVIFEDAQAGVFYLDTLSIAEKQAKVLPGVSIDLDGQVRDPQNPDIGCYEYYPR